MSSDNRLPSSSNEGGMWFQPPTVILFGQKVGMTLSVSPDMLEEMLWLVHVHTQGGC